jgi:ATP-dependent Lon protease
MGGILLLETMLVPGGKGRLVLTGSLGDVIKESAELGLTWVKSKAVALGITAKQGEDPLKNVDIHVRPPGREFQG